MLFLVPSLLPYNLLLLIPTPGRTTTSPTAWQLLANTYAKPSRGHIRQLKEKLKRLTKGTKSVSAYMQAIKTRSDELALLGKPVDDDDLIYHLFEGLGVEYKSVVDAINARDTAISFVELHEKLLNREAFLQAADSTSQLLLASANLTAYRNRSNRRPSTTNSSQPNTTDAYPPPDQHQSKPYLRRFQACGVQGHTAKRCPMFRLATNQHSAPSRPQGSQGYRPSTPWQPRAHDTTLSHDTTPTWLMDSGSSHHVTSDLSNLSLHSPYPGSNDVMIDDGSALSITHIVLPQYPLILVCSLYRMFSMFPT